MDWSDEASSVLQEEFDSRNRSWDNSFAMITFSVAVIDDRKELNAKKTWRNILKFK